MSTIRTAFTLYSGIRMNASAKERLRFILYRLGMHTFLLTK